MRQQRLEFIRRKFAGHPELMDKMTPRYPPAASRPVLVDEDYSVYDALLQDNTTLVYRRHRPDHRERHHGW